MVSCAQPEGSERATTVVELIGDTRTPTGLRVKAKLDIRTYNKAVAITKRQKEALSLHPDAFRGDGDYELHPHVEFAK